MEAAVGGCPGASLSKRSGGVRAMARWTWMGALGVFLSMGCRGPEGLPALPASEILRRSAEAMARIRSAHFVLERTGAPDYLDAARTLMLRRVEGDIVRPDGLQGVARVFTLGAVTEIRMIRIGDRSWIALSGVDRWEALTPERGVVMDPRWFFDAERGIPALLARVPLQGIGQERLDGSAVYHLRGELDSGPLAEWSVGMIAGRLEADLWVEGGTFRILRARLVELESDLQDPTVWTLTLSAFDRPVEIREPPSLRP